MSFDYDFGYSFLLFSSLLKKEERRKEVELSKIGIKTHAFKTGRFDEGGEIFKSTQIETKANSTT